MCEFLEKIHGFIISVFIVSLLIFYSNIEKRQMEFVTALFLFLLYCILFISLSPTISEGIIGFWRESFTPFSKEIDTYSML